MAEDACLAGADARWLCDGRALEERGRALGFEVLHLGQPVPAFVLRFDGQVRAYLNRCGHIPVEMDWQPGEFLDSGKRHIICSIHGAAYEPGSGRCVGGPCGRTPLQALTTRELGHEVYWYPSAGFAPAPVRAASDPT